MYVIIKKKPDSNQWDYPDTPSLFTEPMLNPDNPSELIVKNNASKSAAELGVTEYVMPTPAEIVITGITGDVRHSSDFTRITCNELSNVIVTGTVNIPDKSFAMPLRRDDGRLILFPVSVVSGEFTATLNFPVSGQFVYDDELTNLDLPTKVFTVNTIKVDVLRAAS